MNDTVNSVYEVTKVTFFFQDNFKLSSVRVHKEKII